MNMKKNTLGVKKLTALVVPLTLAVLLAACGGTGSPANAPDPYHIGSHLGISIRVAPGVDRSHGYIALESLKKMAPAAAEFVVDNGITIVEITGPATDGNSVATRSGNTISGRLGVALSIEDMIVRGATSMYDRTDNVIHIANKSNGAVRGYL